MKSVIIVVIVNPYPNYLHESKLQEVTVVEATFSVSSGVLCESHEQDVNNVMLVVISP